MFASANYGIISWKLHFGGETVICTDFLMTETISALGFRAQNRSELTAQHALVASTHVDSTINTKSSKISLSFLFLNDCFLRIKQIDMVPFLKRISLTFRVNLSVIQKNQSLYPDWVCLLGTHAASCIVRRDASCDELYPADDHQTLDCFV